ncbi:MAG: hypothetical protein EOO02_03160 [Chitinophagaceae bacterium]|nr:MAG: hypothetical protein EOO02_03160 [Chitinophagaceae bacterium]
MRKSTFTAILIVITSLGSSAQTSRADSIRAKMQWFSDAKLGIFIHWGMYAVDGVSESWSFHNRQVPFDKYMQQMKGFTASKYDPEQWASLIKESGARYAVITTKNLTIRPKVDACVGHRKFIVTQTQRMMTRDRTPREWAGV